MRTVLLSNHPEAEYLREREKSVREREKQEAERSRRYEEEKRQVEDARAKGLLWKWLVASSRLRFAKWGESLARALWPEPRTPRPTRKEAQLEAGIQGEREVASFLADSLGDEWTLIRGYRNRRGEIDQLLLGPVGIVAIEVKNWNATVRIRGDRWMFEKYDNHRNRVKGPTPMKDGGGRPPSLELNEPADALQEFLARFGQPTPIARVVLFTHKNARLASMEDLTVGVANYTGYVLELIDELEPVLGPTRRAKVEALVIRDHGFHEKRRPRR